MTFHDVFRSGVRTFRIAAAASVRGGYAFGVQRGYILPFSHLGPSRIQTP